MGESLGTAGGAAGSPLIAWLIVLALWQPQDSVYSRGMALARAGQWDAAAEAFRAGMRQAPHDKRFPIELAGVAFKQKKYAAAKQELRRAQHIDPSDSYANDFLATLYFLEGNLEAALKYWNRAGLPRVEQIRVEPEPRADAMLVDRAFAFAPMSTLQREEYLATRARLDLVDLFPGWNLELQPRGTRDGFDAVLHAPASPTWLAMLRGIPYETVYPEARDLWGRGINVASLVRWDDEKRRVSAEVAGPLGRLPEWRWRLFFDGRNENWVLPGRPGFNLKRLEAGAEMESAASGRLTWRAGASISDRWFASSPFAAGRALESRAGLDYSLVRIPERRFTMDAGADTRLGRFFGRGIYSETGGSLRAHWFPRARGDDYETSLRLRAGRGTGAIPFDELPMLGIERDNDLWLRGHAGTSGGKKGSAPMGPSYLLANWDLAKAVKQGSFYRLRVGPFVDAGRVYGAPGMRFGPAGWLCDVGIEARLKVLGAAEIVFTYGRDLRAGRNAWYGLAR